MDKNEALLVVDNLIEWLIENRDLSEDIVTNHELEAIHYLYTTYNHG